MCLCAALLGQRVRVLGARPKGRLRGALRGILDDGSGGLAYSTDVSYPWWAFAVPHFGPFVASGPILVELDVHRSGRHRRWFPCLACGCYGLFHLADGSNQGLDNMIMPRGLHSIKFGN